MNSKKLVNDALMLAIKSHDKQRRKYTAEPYVSHPLNVVKILEDNVETTPEMIAAALLHDVVEDTNITIQDICDQFGTKVGMYVHYCTNVSEKQDGNRAFRKKMDADHFAFGPAESQTIKCADFISNASTIVEKDQKFFHSTYKYEKEYMLSVLTKADPILRHKAIQFLESHWSNPA